MSSGVDWNEDCADRDSDVNRYSRSLAERVPDGVLSLLRSMKPLHAPGSTWHYNSGDTFLLGALISKATGRTLANYLHERIWQPCGMEFDAYYTLEADAGQEVAGSRAGMALRDLARVAKLVLDEGACGGEQVLDRDWTRAHWTPSFALMPDWLERHRALSLVDYGQCWWIDRDGALSAMGFAGQRIYLDRDHRLAIVTLGAHTQAPWLSPAEPDRERELAAFTRGVRDALR